MTSVTPTASPATLRTFAQAMREGAARTRKAIGVYISNNPNTACAIGAAVVGMKPEILDTDSMTLKSVDQTLHDVLDNEFNFITKSYPFRTEAEFQAIFSAEEQVQLAMEYCLWKNNWHAFIVTLNDKLNWTRERIADWIERVADLYE